MRTVLLLHVAATLFMTGVIWIVQVVHYPLFGGVGVDGFDRYAGDHARLISWVVMPAMLLELGTAAWLVLRPEACGGRPWALVGLALVVGVWASTFFLQVPLHSRLQAGFDPDAHVALVRTNWIRTALWSARSGLVMGWLARLLP